MTIAVGVDITSVARIGDVLRRWPRFAERVFTPAERQRCGGKVERFASRWAAKEAVKKLYGTRGLPIPGYRSIEVVNRHGGAPRIRVAGRDTEIEISLTHDAGLAVAVAAVARGVDFAAPALPPPEDLVLPQRPSEGHKGTFGTVVVVAGARGTAGAAVLAAGGAARGGAGKVRLCVPESAYVPVAAQCLEVMVHPLSAPGAGIGERAVLELLQQHLGDADAVVLGPGLGRTSDTDAAVVELLVRIRVPMVVDADGLNIAAAHHHGWHSSGGPVVLTPHPAEMARLLGGDTAGVQADRRGAASGYAAAHGVVVVLKGAATVIAAPDGRVHVDSHSTVALATGGTGDVLAGLCGAMLAGGLDPYQAAIAAVTIHAEAGCAVEATRGRSGALASDLLDALPAAQERLRRSQELSAVQPPAPSWR